MPARLISTVLAAVIALLGPAAAHGDPLRGRRPLPPRPAPTATARPAPSPTFTAPVTPPPNPTPTPAPPFTAAPTASPAGLSIAVQGNHLVDGSGRIIRLLGVNRIDAQGFCEAPTGGAVFAGPTDAASIAAMAAWRINSVRLTLNEDCWLGINGVNAGYGGANYDAAIHRYVDALHASGIYVVLSLQLSAPGTQLSSQLEPAADADHAPAFWASVAASFRNDHAVLFDLFNEPVLDIAAPVGVDPWDCWLNGCTAQILVDSSGARVSQSWQTAGMQQLVDVVRAQGATQPVMLGGLRWANDLTGWIAHLPHDSAGQMVASFHLYDRTRCNTVDCWNQTVAPVARLYPVVTGELGEYDCTDTFINPYMDWADQAGVSYLGFAWIAFSTDCRAGIRVIDNWDGTPSPMGVGFHDHLARLAT